MDFEQSRMAKTMFVFHYYIYIRNGIKLRILFFYASCEGLLQSTILESVGCIWFNRSEAKDREIVTKK